MAALRCPWSHGRRAGAVRISTMDEFVASSLSFPTVVFTVLLGIALVYWVLVILGALGLDALDFDDGGHGGEVGHGDAGHGDGGHGDGHDGHSHGLLGSILGALRLDAVPMTIVLSLIFFFGWLLSELSIHYLFGGNAYVLGGERNKLLETLLLVAVFVLAVLLTSVAIRPLAPVFRTHSAARRSNLVGKIVTIDTSRVDAGFGAARAEDGGAGLIVQVRCDPPNDLVRGARALVVSYDEAREVYEVTALGDLVPPEGDPAKRS